MIDKIVNFIYQAQDRSFDAKPVIHGLQLLAIAIVFVAPIMVKVKSLIPDEYMSAADMGVAMIGITCAYLLSKIKGDSDVNKSDAPD